MLAPPCERGLRWGVLSSARRSLVPGAGLAQSMLIKCQRADLDEIGRQSGTPVVYLKAAWADPVLYGGRGERTGTDVDVLVAPARFPLYAARLMERGFRRLRGGRGETMGRYYGWKEWTFVSPTVTALTVDLHRAVSEPIWFDLPAEDLMARARPYPSVDGDILSLSPEDQILYAALHHANHLYVLGGHHLEDCRRLVAAYPIDWPAVEARAASAHLGLALAILLTLMEDAGMDLPRRALGPWRQVRMRLVQRWITPDACARRLTGGLGSNLFDYLVVRPLLSDRPGALPRMLAAFGLPWLLERVRGLLDRGW
jgi:hypothetical protein